MIYTKGVGWGAGGYSEPSPVGAPARREAGGHVFPIRTKQWFYFTSLALFRDISHCSDE